MVYTNWYPGAPSMTASKYLKYSVAYTKPFEPGQRYRNRRDMELTVSGKAKTMKCCIFCGSGATALTRSHIT